MPIGTPVQLATPIAESTSQSTIAITTTVDVAAGDRILLAVGHNTGTVTGVSDGTSNSYAVDKLQANGTANISLCSAAAATAVPSGSTITVTYSAANSRRYLGAWSVSQLDVVSGTPTGASQFNATAWSSGTTTPADADCLIFGGCCQHGAVGTSTPTSPLNELMDITLSTFGSMTVVYRIVSSIAAYAASGTWTAAAGADQASAVAAYKQGAGAPPQVIRPDADVVTTGWATAPLFSKINDSSDATVVTGTLA